VRVASFALVAAIAAVGGQPEPAAPRALVVVIDGDAPAADPREAARLRQMALERVDEAAAASYFLLNAERLVAIPAAEVASFRRTVFTVEPPTYAGVSVTLAESLEVLRGNEAVRDELIATRCPPSTSECGGAVRAAVEAEVKRVEGASAAKLRSLTAAAEGWPGARVLVLTSGWPTRDDGRVGLRRSMDVLRRRGVSLAIVRVPPREPYRGLVRDASESLAAQMPAGFVTLADDADVARVAAAAGAGASTSSAAASAPSAVPSAAPEPSDHESSTPPKAQPPTPARGRQGDGEQASARAGALDATLRKAATYVARFEQTFTGVVWHERYEQEDRVWRRFGASGATTSTVAARRTLESEMFFAWLPQDGTWISVRDVTAVDGNPVPPEQRRLPALAAQATISLLELRDLARENGRYNVGTIVRTFNEPTLALLFLDDRQRDRVAFSRKGSRNEDRRRLATYTFVEAGRPTLIRNMDRDLPARGSLELDEATGEILKTTIEIEDPRAGLTGSMTVDYRPHVAYDVLVPHDMREAYSSASREQVQASAVYSDFRRFLTSGRIILTP
jgi:hypothetical protein